MYGILFLLVTALSFFIAFALGLGGLGASIIFLLFMTLTSLIFVGRKKGDSQQLSNIRDDRLTD